MNPITKAIHEWVMKTKSEELLVRLRQIQNRIRAFIPVKLRSSFTSVGRFIPQSSEYPKDDYCRLVRDNTVFEINRSDYVQWRLFYRVRDNALKEAKKNLEPGCIVLDIGANFGAFSLRLANYISDQRYSDVDVHAFEPNPAVYYNYENNLKLNPKLSHIVRLHPFGLGDEIGERPFKYDTINTGAGRVLPMKADSETVVNIKRLDEFVRHLQPKKITFIKVIVEGFEPEVLKGGWETIKKFRPPIFLEVTRSWWAENGSATEDVLANLKQLGYQFMIEFDNEMIPYEPSKHASRFQYNLLGKIQ
jgi:FkbM family methyltransferase